MQYSALLSIFVVAFLIQPSQGAFLLPTRPKPRVCLAYPGRGQLVTPLHVHRSCRRVFIQTWPPLDSYNIPSHLMYPCTGSDPRIFVGPTFQESDGGMHDLLLPSSWLITNFSEAGDLDVSSTVTVQIYWIRHGYDCANTAMDDGFTWFWANRFKGQSSPCTGAWYPNGELLTWSIKPGAYKRCTVYVHASICLCVFILIPSPELNW